MQEFDDIYDKQIVKRYVKHEIKRLSKRENRKRDIGAAGRPFKLDLKDRFVMLLVYYRLYITYTLAGFLFDLDQSSICRDIQKIESLIRNCLPIPQKIYKITKRLQTLDKVEKYFPGFISFIDSTSEQRIPRPKDNKRKRKTYYSGKKKRHTAVKTQFVVNNHGFIVHKTDHKKESRHDYDIYKKNHPLVPKDVVNVFDLGYIGIEKDFSEQLSSLPYKKKRGRVGLLQEEINFNQEHAKKRIVIEHTICRLKKYKIIDLLRN